MRLRWSLLGFLCLIALVGCEEVSARRNIQEGNKLYYTGKYEDAIKKYEEALAVSAKLPEGWFNLGLTHLALFAPGSKDPENEGHAKGAIDAFQKYLTLVPSDELARDYLISTYVGSGRYDGAIEYYLKELEKNPNNLQAVAQLAFICTQAGRYDDAIRWHKKKADMVTDPAAKADSWYTIGVLAFRRLNQHPEVIAQERLRIADEGIGWLQQADAMRPEHKDTIVYINLLFRERGLAHGASYARVVDTATAEVYRKRASELAKKL